MDDYTVVTGYTPEKPGTESTGKSRKFHACSSIGTVVAIQLLISDIFGTMCTTFKNRLFVTIIQILLFTYMF